tara:strand:+ start:1362 stop:2315 length:954 start_codon:yes stop_codon:yes gene_type:complete
MFVSTDMYEYITNFTDEKTLLNMLSVNSKFRSEEIFKRIIQRKYPLLLEFKKELSYHILFTRMISHIIRLENEYGIPYIPTKDYNPLVLYNSYDKRTGIYDHAMAWASGGGHIDIVRLMLEKGAINMSNCLRNAAIGGYLEIVQLMWSEGARNLNDSMGYASKGGHMETVKWLIEKGASEFNWGMEYGADGGHMNIVQFFLSQGANNFDSSMRWASTGGHIDIVRLMLEKGANNFDECLVRAAEEGHLEIVQLMIELGDQLALLLPLRLSASNGHIEIVRLILGHALNLGPNKLLGVIEIANINRHSEVANLLKQYL